MCSCQAMVSTPSIDCAARLARAGKVGRQARQGKARQDSRTDGWLRIVCSKKVSGS